MTQGVAKSLTHSELKEQYSQFHQQILVSDSRTIGFYNKCGFEVAGTTQSMWIYAGDEH